MEIITYITMIIAGAVAATLYFLPWVDAIKSELEAKEQHIKYLQEHTAFAENLADELGG